jgi:hypothetical protein
MDVEENNQDYIFESKLLDLLKVSDPTIYTVFLNYLTFFNDTINDVTTKCNNCYES